LSRILKSNFLSDLTLEANGLKDLEHSFEEEGICWAEVIVKEFWGSQHCIWFAQLLLERAASQMTWISRNGCWFEKDRAAMRICIQTKQ